MQGDLLVTSIGASGVHGPHTRRLQPVSIVLGRNTGGEVSRYHIFDSMVDLNSTNC